MTELSKYAQEEKLLRLGRSLFIPVFTPLEAYGGITVISLLGRELKDFKTTSELLAAVRSAPKPSGVREPIVPYQPHGKKLVFFYKFREEGKPGSFMSSLKQRKVRAAFDTVCTRMKTYTEEKKKNDRMNDRMEVDDKDEDESIPPKPLPARKPLSRKAKIAPRTAPKTPKPPPPANKGEVDEYISKMKPFGDTNNRKSTKRAAKSASDFVAKYSKTDAGRVEILDMARKNILGGATTVETSVIDSAPLDVASATGLGALKLLDQSKKHRQKGGKNKNKGGRPNECDDQLAFITAMQYVTKRMEDMEWGRGDARVMAKKVQKELKVTIRQAREGVRMAVEYRETGKFTLFKNKERLKDLKMQVKAKFSQWMHEAQTLFPPDNKSATVIIGATRVVKTSVKDGKKKRDGSKMVGGEAHAARINAFR